LPTQNKPLFYTKLSADFITFPYNTIIITCSVLKQHSMTFCCSYREYSVSYIFYTKLSADFITFPYNTIIITCSVLKQHSMTFYCSYREYSVSYDYFNQVRCFVANFATEM